MIDKFADSQNCKTFLKKVGENKEKKKVNKRKRERAEKNKGKISRLCKKKGIGLSNFTVKRKLLYYVMGHSPNEKNSNLKVLPFFSYRQMLFSESTRRLFC